MRRSSSHLASHPKLCLDIKGTVISLKRLRGRVRYLLSLHSLILNKTVMTASQKKYELHKAIAHPAESLLT